VTRLVLAFVALAASTACASAGAYAPRPFPTSPAPAISAPAPARPASRPVHTPVPAATEASGVAVTPISGPSIAPGTAPDVTSASSDRGTTAAAILATALDLRGIPYRLGGTDLNGFDCSGFVQYVLRQHAIDMPRTVIEQFDVGASTRDVEAGDLVFFQTVGSKASHVGIALDSQSFVHAPNSRGVVRVERFDTPYWSSRFLGARRVF